jgi:hypothetical protein
VTVPPTPEEEGEEVAEVVGVPEDWDADMEAELAAAKKGEKHDYTSSSRLVVCTRYSIY